MKKIILLMIFVNTFIFASELETVNTYKEALVKAKSENKLVLFVTSIDSCPSCNYMNDIVFKREHIVDYLNKNFVVVIKDVNNYSYPQRFHTRDTPTFYFVNPNDEKEVREPKVGGSRPELFLGILKEAMGDVNATKTTTSRDLNSSDDEGYEDEHCSEDDEGW